VTLDLSEHLGDPWSLRVVVDPDAVGVPGRKQMFGEDPVDEAAVLTSLRDDLVLVYEHLLDNRQPLVGDDPDRHALRGQSHAAALFLP